MHVQHHPPVPGVLSEADAECAVNCILAGCESKPVQAIHKVKDNADAVKPADVVKELRVQGVDWWNILKALPAILVLLVPGTQKLADIIAQVIALIVSWSTPQPAAG